ncbi:MAG: hypothetical protein K2X93_09280, partial [Candidatus Obscuribacterales bacterium]|nr:hypothetical protein [Candidatus Obscuribacterales bacterium]
AAEGIGQRRSEGGTAAGRIYSADGIKSGVEVCRRRNRSEAERRRHSGWSDLFRRRNKKRCRNMPPKA